MSTKLDFDKFTFEQVIYQIIFDNSYMLWDSTGKIWTKLKEQYSELKLANDPSPNLTTFRIGNKYQFEVHLNKMTITSNLTGRSFDDFIEKANYFFNTCVDILSIKTFIRMGFRLISSQEFSTKESVSDIISFISSEKIKDMYGISAGRKLYPDLAFKYENEYLGVRFNIKSAQRNFKIEPEFSPWPQTFPVRNMEQNIVLIDIDYYTLMGSTSAQIDFKEWANSTSRVIKKDTNKILKIINEN